jgi:hypothetical protein
MSVSPEFNCEPNATLQVRRAAGAERMLYAVTCKRLLGPDSVGETQCVEKGKPYLAGCPALSIMRIGAGFRRAKTGLPYFADCYGSCSTLLRVLHTQLAKGQEVKE